MKLPYAPVQTILQLLLLAVVVAACAGDEPSRPGPTVQDSAGVEVVDHLELPRQDRPAWRVPDEPRLVIGGPGSHTGAELFRVASVRRARDGTIVVANTGTHDVRLFGPDGAPRGSFGREGDGPGEFRFLAGAWPFTADSILTFDGVHRRAQVFSRAGELGRTLELSGPAGPESLAGMTADRSLVTYRTISSAPGMQRSVRSRVLYRRSGAGELLDSIGVVRWQMIIPQESEDGLVALGAPIFSTTGQVAVGGRRIYSSDATDPIVEVRDASGRLVRAVRWVAEDRSVTPEDRERFEEDLLAAAGSVQERRGAEALLRGAEWSESFPALSDLLADPDGRLWVQQYRRPGDVRPPRWWVFDVDGRFDGVVELPDGFELHEIGKDYLLGVARGDLGLEQVRMYPLETLGPRGR